MSTRHFKRAAIVLASVLAGCASGGNEVLKSQDIATVNLNIVDGKTTRDEVQKIYGGPTRATISGTRNEVWTYIWAHTAPQAQNFVPVVGVFARRFDIQKKQLIIVFDDNNVVIKHSITETNESIKRDFSSTPSPSTSPSSSTTPPPSGTPMTPVSPAPASSSPASTSALPSSSVLAEPSSGSPAGAGAPTPAEAVNPGTSPTASGSPSPADPVNGPVIGLSRYRL